MEKFVLLLYCIGLLSEARWGKVGNQCEIMVPDVDRGGCRDLVDPYGIGFRNFSSGVSHSRVRKQKFLCLSSPNTLSQGRSGVLWFISLVDLY